jgi:hypothetical protein
MKEKYRMIRLIDRMILIVALAAYCAIAFATGVVFHLVTLKEGPYYVIEMREKYGTPWVLDSVNLVVEKDGNFIVTRAGNLYGVFARENYSWMVRGR